MVEKESLKRKKRKINKNLFNRGKINKLIQKKDKENSSKFLINVNNNSNNDNKNISNNNSNNDNNNFKDIKENLKEKPDFLAKKKFVKDIFNSTRRKREKMQNNISSYNYKIFKEKEKPNLFLKNKSNMNNDAINLFVSRTKSLSKHNSNIFSLQKKLNGAKTNKNKLYIVKKEKEGLIIFDNRDNSNILKNSGFTIRPSSCVNKSHEGIISNNKRIIRFTKQDKKIYLKTNKEKKNEIKKTRINVDNINNIAVNLDKSLKKENEETKDNKKNKRNMIIDLHNNQTRNIITDIFFVKNLEERNNINLNVVNEGLMDNNKNKLIQSYNKAKLL